MNIKKILTPTKSKLLLFAILFSGVHGLNLVLIFLITGSWDGGLTVGFPIPFYTISCGDLRFTPDFVCNYGLNPMNLLINILFWYGVTVVIKKNK